MAYKLDEAYHNILEFAIKTAKAKGLVIKPQCQTLDMNVVRTARIIDKENKAIINIEMIELDEEEFDEVN